MGGCARRVRFRRAQPFTAEEEAIGQLAAEHAAVALAGLGGNGKQASPLRARELLRLGGDALATGLDEQRTAEEIARLAAQGSGAEGAVVWRLDDELQPYVAGTFGDEGHDERDVVEALAVRMPFAVTSRSWVLLLSLRWVPCSSGSSSRSSPLTRCWTR